MIENRSNNLLKVNREEEGNLLHTSARKKDRTRTRKR